MAPCDEASITLNGPSHLLRSFLSSINIPGYPTDGEIRHLAHLLKPHRRGLGKTDPPKVLIASQLLEARKPTSIPPDPCGEVSGGIGTSGVNSRHTQPRALIVCQLLNRPWLRGAFRFALAP
jgi:hypothetical protein